MDELKSLNPEQKKAVKYHHGPLLIIAGAGTGKTTVITEKIKYLVQKGLAKPEEILALTFTDKAANEMESRVEEAMPYGYVQMWVMTFHSFCDRILHQEALNIGLDYQYRLLTQSESIQLLRQNLFKLNLNYFRPLGNPTKFLTGLLQHFSRLQDEDISPNDYLKWVEVKLKANLNPTEEEKTELFKFKELALAYRAYDEIKTKESLFDFGDLIVKTLFLFRSRPNILEKYRRLFQYILVDEFQDTNFSQYELVKLLTGPKSNLTVVGDDDQSIYRFRGAAVSNILQFQKDFPQAKVVVLTQNYRSTQKILDRAYSLIQHNNPDRLEVAAGVDKRLRAIGRGKNNSEVVFSLSGKGEDEAEWVAKKIKELKEEENYRFRDFAVLTRANSQADSFIRAFSRRGIPYQFLGPGRLFKQPEIIDLIAYLKVLDDPTDSVSLYRVLAIDYFDISARDLALIGSFAKRKNLSLFEVCEKLEELSIEDKSREKISLITGIITKHLRLLKRETAGQILYYFLEESGLIKGLVSPDTAEAQRKANNIAKFFEKIKDYESNHIDAGVSVVVDWLELSAEMGDSPLVGEIDWEENNEVNILTVHSAKGLEFPVVFLVNLVEQRFPSLERRELIPIPEELIKEILPQGDYHLEEERRLFYVGMTRAKNRLFLTAARFYGDARREKRLSPFVLEALGEAALREKPFSMGNQLSLLNYQPLILESKKEKVKPYLDYLSYSQIDEFKICPLHYKLKYLVKIPTPPSASQSFGNSIHFALRDFYRLKEGGAITSFRRKDLAGTLTSLLEKNWQSEGFLSRSHERESFRKAEGYLVDYLKSEFNPQVKTVLTEENFTIPLLRRNPDERPLKIGGRIDRVDLLPDGRIEIVDYKTGANIPSQREIDKDLQMSFYALAATTLRDFPFGKKPEEIKLTFYYFEEQKKITTVRTAEELTRTINEIFRLRKEIENSDFACSGSYLCRQCEFKLFCSPRV